MGSQSRLNWARTALLSSLAAGWLVGFGIHGSAAAASGWGDVPYEALLLGVALCAWAGVVAWVAAPQHRRRRAGALAGLLMVATFALGNVMVTVLWVEPAHLGGNRETWFSFLLESWFWIGLPTACSLCLGALGWTAADALGRSRHQEAA